MPHLLELAKTGRAKCRGCGTNIASGTLRLGERVPNPFDDEGGETTHWYHIVCNAYMRPESFLPTVAENPSVEIENRDTLVHEAELGKKFRRLPRATSVEKSASGRAVCRECKQAIEKDAWRIALKYYEDGRFAPSGFVHIGCAAKYFETTEVLTRLRHFSPEISEPDWTEIAGMLK